MALDGCDERLGGIETDTFLSFCRQKKCLHGSRRLVNTAATFRPVTDVWASIANIQEVVVSLVVPTITGV